MVCGRYPKEIRHYEKSLKRKSFVKLKNNVWENKIKWQLILKADCHNRLRLLSCCFHSWMIYVKCAKKKNLDKNKAEEHYQFKLKRKALRALSEEIEKNCELLRNFRKRAEFNLKRRIFGHWRQYVNFRSKIKTIKNIADNIRCEILIVNYLDVWLQRLNEKNELEIKFKNSIGVYENFLKRKAFNKLKLHANRRRNKKEMENFLACRYEKILKKKVFNGWKNFAAKKRLHRDFTEKIDFFHENYLIKHYLDVWVTRHENLMEEKLAKKNLEAENFYIKKLLINFFRRIKKFTEKKRRENFLALKFFEFYKKEIVKSYLQKCRDGLRQKIYYDSLELKAVNFRQEKLIEIYFHAIRIKFDEIKNEEIKLSNAVVYYENNLLGSYFNFWMNFVIVQREKRKKFCEADRYYETRLKAKIFDEFEKFLILKRRKKLGINFYHFNLKLKAVKKWKLYRERKKIKKLKMEIACRQYSLKIQRKCFCALQSGLISKRKKIAQAFCFYEKNVMKKTFSRWKNFTSRKVNFNLKMSHFKLTISNVIIEKFLSIWYERYEKKLFLDRKIELLEEDRQKRILRVCFTNWRDFFLKKKKIREKEVLFLENFKPLIVLESYVCKLYDLYDDKKKEEAKFKLASTLEEKLIKRKYFKKWLAFKKWKEGIAVNCENKLNYVYMGNDFKTNLERNPVSNFRSERRQPMIPSYLMNRIEVNSEPRKARTRSDETYTVLFPVNKKLPNVDWGDEVDLSESYDFV